MFVCLLRLSNLTSSQNHIENLLRFSLRPPYSSVVGVNLHTSSLALLLKTQNRPHYSQSSLLKSVPTQANSSSSNSLEKQIQLLYNSTLSISSSTFKMTTQAAVSPASTTSESFSRLPKTAIPKHYILCIKPDLEKFSFEGTESVLLKIQKETPTLVLNSADLTVSDIEWVDELTKKVQKASKVELVEANELLKVSFNPALPVGNGILNMKFIGTLNDKMKGFYRSKYKGPNGEDRYNAVTQFESTDARRCFPCWDEPAVKSTFNVTLIVPKDRVALSNMPVKSTTPYGENLKKVEFDTTPIMSTYLLACCIGEFDYLEDRSSDGVLCRVYTSVGKKEQGRFALDITTKVLPFYKEYFGIAYPLPKLDLIAIADFSQGAMENWGLITYRETCLLVDETETTATNRQWVALVVGHEIAHQWFGNLVTMEWWTHLWLNEGYASFVEFLCVDHLFPEYDIWTQFVTDSHNRALELDCLNSSHAIEVPVLHPSEIEEIFDDISYSKGSAIIRMLHNFIGDKDFRKGMNIYLNRHKYSNTFTEDLWKALEEASSKPVGAVMTTWTKQMGFPVLTIHDVKQDGNCRTLSLTQEKFWPDPSSKKKTSASKDYFWMVPIAFSSGAAPTKVIHETLMDKKTVKITLVDVDASHWIKVNPGIHGFYRVQYPMDMLNQFLPAIKSKSLPPLDRLGLLDDLSALVQSGQSSTVEVLSLLQAFVHEDNYTVWASISNIVGKLNLLLGYCNNHDDFKAFGRDLFSVILENVGWEQKESENHLQTMLRSLVLNRMSTFGDEKTLKEANKRFALHISGERLVPADLRSAVYKSALAIGNEDTFKTMLKLYRDAEIQEEKDRISRSLGAIKDINILKQVLDFAVSDEVRSQDTVTFFISVGMGSKNGRELAWNYFKDNYKLFQQKYPKGTMVSRIIKYVAENFVTEEKALEVEAFFRNHSFSSTERAVQQAVENIRLNEAWLKRDLPSIQNYLIKKLN